MLLLGGRRFRFRLNHTKPDTHEAVYPHACVGGREPSTEHNGMAKVALPSNWRSELVHVGVVKQSVSTGNRQRVVGRVARVRKRHTHVAQAQRPGRDHHWLYGARVRILECGRDRCVNHPRQRAVRARTVDRCLNEHPAKPSKGLVYGALDVLLVRVCVVPARHSDNSDGARHLPRHVPLVAHGGEPVVVHQLHPDLEKLKSKRQNRIILIQI